VFASVVSENVNGVNQSVFEYLKNITSDVQENFNNIFNRITSIQYFTDNQTTYISNNTYCDNLGSNDIEAQIVNVSNINNQQLNTFSIRTNELKSNTITAQRINHNFDIGLFLVIDGFYTLPLMKSQTLPEYPLETLIYGHLKPNYAILCKTNTGELLVSLQNDTDDFMYNILIPSSCRTVELYLNGRILL
jgi:hypothetical protein